MAAPGSVSVGWTSGLPATGGGLIVEEKRLGEILVEEGKASPQDVQRALDMQARVGGRVGRLLVAMGIVAEEVLVAALSRQLRIPKVSLRGRTAGPGLVALIPAEVARRRTILPVALSRAGDHPILYVATADPTDKAAIEEAAQVSGLEVIPLLAPYDELCAALERSYGGSEPAVPAPPPSPEERFEAVVRVLLRKGIVTAEELQEELRRR